MLIQYIKSNIKFRAKIENGVFIRTEVVIYCENDDIRKRVDDLLMGRYSISSVKIKTGLSITGVDADKLIRVLGEGDFEWPNSDQVNL